MYLRNQKAFILSGLNLIGISNGFLFGHTAGLVSSLQKREEIDLTDSEISLIASSLITLCLIGFGLVAAVTDAFGRRIPCIIFSVGTVINWIVLYYSKHMYQFMISRLIGGVSVGSLCSLTIFVTSEYTSPNTRAFFLNMITTTAPAVGTGMAHAIGTVLHWRDTALIGIALAIIGAVYPYFWVESPHWLASKGKFEACETTFRILHGTKPQADRELQLLIKVEKSKQERAIKANKRSTLNRLFLAFKRKYFWSLLILSVVMNAYFAAGAKLVFSLFATIILEDISGTSDVILFMLLVDGFIVLGSCMSCFLITKTSMRTLLFSTGLIANATLILFSICFYLKNGQAFFNWINVVLLAFYFIMVNAGPYPVLEAILSEMFPLELKVYTFFITSITMVGFFTLASSLFPYIVSSIGYHGFFLMNAAIMSLCLGYIWLIIPETKGRALQEIETYFKTKNFDVDEVLRSNHKHALI